MRFWYISYMVIRVKLSGVKKKDIIAVGDPKGKCKIKGWSGKFNIVLPDKKKIENNVKISDISNFKKCLD